MTFYHLFLKKCHHLFPKSIHFFHIGKDLGLGRGVDERGVFLTGQWETRVHGDLFPIVADSQSCAPISFPVLIIGISGEKTRQTGRATLAVLPLSSGVGTSKHSQLMLLLSDDFHCKSHLVRLSSLATHKNIWLLPLLLTKWPKLMSLV